MDQYYAPCILLYNIQSGELKPITDRLGFYEHIRIEFIKQLDHIRGNAEEPYQLTIKENSYEITYSKIHNEEGIFIIVPLMDGSSYLSVEMERTLRDQQQRLFQLVKQKKISMSAIQSMLQELCETITLLVECEQVSIWMLNEEQTILQCKNLYNANMHQHSLGAELLVENLPIYFNEIQKNRSLAVNDIVEDKRVVDLIETGYSIRMGNIQSLLDVPLVLSTGIGGVLCCDSLKKKQWTELNQTIAGLLGDMISFLFERINRIKVEEKMAELAYHDPLTGLYNHYAFLEKVNEKMRLLKNKKGYLVYLQLDQFMSIQDALGYSSGDEVLILTANRLKKAIQNDGLISRVGFGHFTLFLSLEDDENIQCYMERLREYLHEPMYIQHQDVYITHSYGVSIYPEHGTDAKKCVQMAQIALNIGKKHNMRSVRAEFSKGMVSIIEDDLLAEMNLRKGLDQDEFELYYQPQVDCFTGKVTGVEGLLRWNHPEKGLIGPGEFIGLAESTGLIIAIGEWVIDQAFQQLEKWKMQKKTDLSISINISPRHFMDDKLYRFLKKSLEKYDINSEQLVIEITENVAMEDFQTVKKRIENLRGLGFYVSIDDFGTGFSAFQYLQHFPVQEIKIDRQFIRDITESKVSLGIAKTIIDLAKFLNLNVVSEGVETNEQWELLKSLGCPELQGFFFSKPKPMRDLQVIFDGLKK